MAAEHLQWGPQQRLAGFTVSFTILLVCRIANRLARGGFTVLTLGVSRLLVTPRLADGLVAQSERRGHATRHQLRKPARCVASGMSECTSRSRYPVRLQRPIDFPPRPPWAASSRLLHLPRYLDVLNSGSYVSKRAKQLGKVRETRFVWARLATALPSTHPKRPGPRLGPHATHFLK